MNELKYLWLSLSLLLLLGKARASCLIPRETMSTNHVFLSFENNVYDLLHSDTVPASRSIYLLCGGGTAPRKFDCNVHGLFNPSLPTSNCKKVFKPVVEEIDDPSCPLPATMHRVGYNYGGRFLEIYRICYDGVRLAAQFSIHKVYRSTDSASRNPFGFVTDRAMTGEEVAAFKNENIYKCLENNLGPNQSIMQSDDRCFNRGHLTPVADFPFEQLQKATFKIRNVVPQYASVNNGNWKAVESWIRRLLDRRNYDVLKVCTGALEVHTLRNQQPTNLQMIPIYLLNNNKIPVPGWTYKIVSHLSGASYVVVTQNDGLATRRPDPRSFCQIIGCDADLKRDGKGFTFCCKHFEFIRDNLPHLSGVC